MNEENISQILFVIFQPIPHREKVYIWINGDKKKEIIKFDTFKKWIIESEQEQLIPLIMKALMTYSFFLWDKKNGQAYYLQPNIHNPDFKKPFFEEAKAEEKKKATQGQQEEKDSMKLTFDSFTMINLEDAKKREKI